MGKEMLDLYAFLLKSMPNLRFLFVSQDDLSELKDYASKIGIPQSYVIQISARREEVPAIVSLMTVSVFFILPAYSKIASSPTKQGELMAMGIPIICNDRVGDTADLIQTYDAGEVISNFEESDFQNIADNWKDLINKSAGNIRLGAKSYFALSKGIEKYSQVYSFVLND